MKAIAVLLVALAATGCTEAERIRMENSARLKKDFSVPQVLVNKRTGVEYVVEYRGTEFDVRELNQE